MTPTLGDLARVFGRIGVMSFGGPAAQISLMHQELVEKRPWLDDQTFLRALSLCMLLPGPEAMQLATYSGWRLKGVSGGLLAGGLFVIPGAIVIAVLTTLYAAYGALPLVQSAFLGIKAAVIIIVLQALLSLSRRALVSGVARSISVLAFIAIFVFNLPFPLIIALAATWGLMTSSTPTTVPSSIKRPSDNPVKTAAIWLTLWLLPLFVVTASGHQLLSDLGWFFARMAVVTFGGAYAVLAYMTQTVVDQYHWISTDQMIDALGLAETTPGPLILVTQFVAMLSGHIQGGFAFSIAAGLVALWATFVPCFLWIFLAAPYLEQISTRPRLAAALAAISAAVVGVILNLSVWFALNVLFGALSSVSFGPMSFSLPDPSQLNVEALLLTTFAGVLVFGVKFRIETTLVILAVTGTIGHFI